MHNFKMIKHDSVVYVFLHNNEFKKFIKAKDLPSITEDITAYFKLIGVKIEDPINPDGTFDFNVDISSTESIEVLKRITVGKNKEEIELPSSLNRSHQLQRPLVYSHKNLDDFVDYWNNMESDSLKLRLFELLSEDIIEVPYVDNPSDYEFRYNQVAFHLNHGTAHGIRLVTYFNQFVDLFNLMDIHFSEEMTTIPLLTNEEKHCLQLAMFLLRSGRTDELGWKDDSSYSLRSAHIFSSIALKLGYEPNLVRIISQCFDYKQSITFEEGFYSLSPNISTQKAALYQNLIGLSHISDLVRCNSSYPTLAENMQNMLSPYLNSFKCIDIDGLIHDCLIFAATCCKKTGASVVARELNSEQSSIYFGNPYVAVNSATKIKDTFANLQLIAVEFQSKIQGTVNDVKPQKSEIEGWFKSSEQFHQIS